VEVLGGQTGIPKGLKKTWKFRKERGVNNFGIQRVRWGVKMCMPPVVGYGYFLESPILDMHLMSTFL